MARQDDYIRTALRLPPDLHAAIHEAAAATGKSFNAEIIARLQSSFGGRHIHLNISDGVAATDAPAAHSEQKAANALLEYQLASAKVEELRQWRLSAFFARAVASFINAISKRAPDASKELQDEIDQIRFLSGMYPVPPDEALSNATHLKFLTDKRQALLRQLSSGEKGRDFSYEDELQKTDAEIAKLVEQQREIKLPSRPLP